MVYCKEENKASAVLGNAWTKHPRLLLRIACFNIYDSRVLFRRLLIHWASPGGGETK